MDRLRAMEYLLRVVNAGSFVAAARELGVSPPAVTHMIAALEKDLGVALLRRHSRHLSLTPDGEHLLPAVQYALAELRAAEAGLSVNRTRSSGNEIYFYFPNGVSGSSLWKHPLDRVTGVPVTMRNWNTVNKLYEMAMAGE